MIFDKIRTAEAFGELKSLPPDYRKRFDSMNISQHLKELLLKVATALLTKADVPEDEIEAFIAQIDERGISEMIALENYSVRETRRLAREEVMREVEQERRRAEQAEAEIEKLRLENAELRAQRMNS